MQNWKQELCKVDCSQLIKTHSVTGYSKTCTLFLVKDHTRFFEAMYGIHTHVKKAHKGQSVWHHCGSLTSPKTPHVLQMTLLLSHTQTQGLSIPMNVCHQWFCPDPSVWI